MTPLTIAPTRRLLAAACTGLAALALHGATRAEVIRFEVLQSAPAFEGRSFGNVGPYLKITARATIAVDPGDPRNAVIADIDRAPRNAQGRVEATTDVVILRPADAARGNGTLLLDVPNRGRKLAPQLFDDAQQPGANAADKAADAGLGFPHTEGYTMVWVGWQADMPSLPSQHALVAPVLRGVTGASRDEFLFDHTRSPATATLAWPIADPASLAVTVRARWDAPREKPAGLSIRATGANTVEITRPASGFDAAALYEVTYTARDPAVLGLGFAATRDVVSFLRRDTSASNPLAVNGRPTVQRAIGFGVSQSGRFLRDFLYFGFNEDLAGGLVFEGLMPHVAGARRMATNVRFGLPGRNARHPQDPAWQADPFPFTYQTLHDPLSGRRDGLMQRCRLSATCPRVIQTDSEHEWWASRASLLVTDLAGNHLELPPDVRAYMIAGTPHFAERPTCMRNAADDGPARQPDACGPADARAAERDAGVDRRRRRAAGQPRADARARHAGERRIGDGHRHPAPGLQRHLHRRQLHRCHRCFRPRSSAAIRCSCRVPMPTAWRSPASACCRWPCRAPPTPDGTRAPRASARARCSPCKARSCRSPRRARSARPRATHGPRWPSVMPMRRRTCRPCAPPRRSWWPSA